MTEEVKKTALLEVAKMGAFALIMVIVSFVLYQQNVSYQTANDDRMRSLEEQFHECNDSKQEIMLDQIEKSNDLMRLLLAQTND